MKKKIVLVDGHNLLFRMFFGIPAKIKNSHGMEIRGLVGFIGSLKKIINEFNPYSIIVIFDSETSRDNNLLIDSDYKANRVDYSDILDEDNPFSQLPIIKMVLEYLDIFNIEVDFNEADDYIASIIENNKDKELEFIIVSNDSDFIQLVDDNTFLYVMRGKNSVLYDKEEVRSRYNISSDKYVLFKALVGDKSDNIKGVNGIGKVIASRILEYDSIEEYIYNNSDSRYSKMLLDNKEKINKNIELIKMNKKIDTSIVQFSELNNIVIEYKTYEIIDGIGLN